MMFNNLDLSMSHALLTALAVCLLQPFCLLAITRLPQLAGQNALQFLLSAMFVIVLWLGLICIAPHLRPVSLVDTVICLMTIAGVMLLYLEVWGLLSRGYTLGILLTLWLAKHSLRENEISVRYRDGDGLAWIMQHRLHGLVTARLVKLQGGRVILTPVRGLKLAQTYAACITALGLRRTG